MSKLNFEYTAPRPHLPTLPVATREGSHQRLRGTVTRAAQGIEEFNPRVLNSPALLEDCLWMADGWQRLRGMANSIEGFDQKFDLPATGDVAGIAVLLRRIQKTLAPWLFFAPLPDPDRPRPEVPKMFEAELRNPYLLELEHDPTAIKDRIEIEARDPNLAAYLKQEAEGGPSFLEYYRMKDDLRFSKAARQFIGGNPFLQSFEGTEIERMREIRTISDSNRILARDLEGEAKLTGFNPFAGLAKNKTNCMKLFNTDVSLAFVLETVGDYRERQEAAEIAETEQQARDLAQRAAEAKHRAQIARR